MSKTIEELPKTKLEWMEYRLEKAVKFWQEGADRYFGEEPELDHPKE